MVWASRNNPLVRGWAWRYRWDVIVGVLVALLCGLSFWLVSIPGTNTVDNPGGVYRYYESDLHRYAERLQAGEVRYVEGRGYGIPKFLINNGARYVVKQGDCFVVIFGFMPTDAVPELWFSPQGFDPLPADLASRKQGSGYFDWEQLSPQWGACYWDQ